MEIAQVEGTSEFTLESVYSQNLANARRTVDLNDGPFLIKEKHLIAKLEIPAYKSAIHLPDAPLFLAKKHRCTQIVREIYIGGLMCMHRIKLVHRDLKRANCLMNKDWIVKICDFGLSQQLTMAHMTDCLSAGTPEWMAPELIRNDPFTEKCDIFSLGVIIWELCTLHRP